MLRPTLCKFQQLRADYLTVENFRDFKVGRGVDVLPQNLLEMVEGG